VPARALTPECLEAVAGRNPEVGQVAGDLELAKLAPRHRLDVHETLDPSTPGQGFSVREAMNQRTGVYATW
jgi:hypothetical protein